MIGDPAFAIDPEARAALNRSLVRGDATVTMVARASYDVAGASSLWHLEDGRIRAT